MSKEIERTHTVRNSTITLIVGIIAFILFSRYKKVSQELGL